MTFELVQIKIDSLEKKNSYVKKVSYVLNLPPPCQKNMPFQSVATVQI